MACGEPAAGRRGGAHWIADRQTGPLILRYGSEEPRQRYLPGIAKGELYACIGLSEPGAGSDLAAVRTTARETAEGWRINGQNIWTTGAHFSHIMLALIRTEEGSERNAGLSQLLIDLDTPGITIRPIIDMAGHHDFNEVFFDDALVPHGALVGERGQGWKQVTAELGLERYLSSHALLVALIDAAGPEPDPAVATLIDERTAEMWTLRQLLRALLIVSPSFSLRGGTREVIRGIIARGLGLR